MSPSSAQAVGSTHYVWKVDGKPLSVDLSFDVIRQMQALLAVETAGRTPEVGGILFGQVQQVESSWRVSVNDFATVPCEYVRGASWTLSARDRHNFARVLFREKRRTAVGWFRTHTRPGLFLDQHDFRLFSNYFQHPASVALAIRPEANQPSEAGFFFWEEGDIRRSAPYRSFAFVAPAVPTVVVPAPPPEQVVLPAPAVAKRAEVHQPAPRKQVAPQPVSHKVARASGSRPASFPWRKVAYGAPVAAGLLAGLLWQPQALREARSRTAVAGNRSPVAAAEPPPVTAPAALERTVFAPPEALPAEAASALPEPAATPSVVRRQSASRVKTSVRKQFAVAFVTPRRPVLEPELDLRAPEIQASVNPDSVPMPPRITSRSKATVESVQVSGLRRAVGSIPGLGFLKRKKNAEAFVPPRPIHQFELARHTFRQENEPVRVKVTVDSSGEVASAQVMSRNLEPEVARAAVEAARKWRFAPATVDDKPVSAQLILSFAAAGDSRGM